MKGVPKNDNFKVINISTGEERLYKTLQDIAKEYNTNYYTIRELYRANEENIEKKFQRKLSKLTKEIKIVSI